LSTHAVVGGALASLFPSHPVAAFAVGLALAIGILAPPSTIVAVLAGAVAAMLPDPLQFVHTIHPHSSASIDGLTQRANCVGQSS
jgi:hypothetical protein